MLLQTSNLMMVGLGSLRDSPPSSEQPPLTDAIHLRWAFKRELGFPWFGFYLFRRLHQRGNISWLSQHTGSLQKGTWTSTRLQTPFGEISSDAKLVLTDDFPPAGAVEFDLDNRGYLRVAFPESVRYVETRMGFRLRPGEPPPVRKTVTFTGSKVSRGPNPRTEDGVVFETRDRGDRVRPNTFIRSLQTSSGTISGLGCKFRLNITLPQPATFVEVTLTGAARRDRPEGTPVIEVFNQDGTRADSASMRDPSSREPETFLLKGRSITRVVIDERSTEEDDQDRVLLNELTFGTAVVSEVRLTAFAQATPVRSEVLRGYAGRIIATTIEFDGISSVEMSPGPAALIDLATVPFAQDATAGWERLRDFPYPLRLPITHPDYPCTPQASEDFTRSKQLAADRIQYGSPQAFTPPSIPITSVGTITVTNGSPIVTGTGTNWTTALLDAVLQVTGDNTVYTVARVESATRLVLSRNYSGASRSGAQYSIARDPFGQLYSYLAILVAGGKAAGPMANRTIASSASDTGPHMPAQSPLDMVLLGSLHPAVAQMSGLYWSDRTADVEQTYDYLIVGDYNGVGELNADKMLAVVRQSGFANVDGAIVYNLRMAQAPPLPGPERLELYALPGSSRRSGTTSFEESTNNTGLRWDLNRTALGVLLPGRAVMYHLWRANLGNAATPSGNARYDLLTKQTPVLVTEAGVAAQTAPDWPPFPLHAIDNNLAEGWYSYQISGIDIFGRHSANSAAGVWRQWSPAPEPRPWYYLNAPSDAVIHPAAIRLLTKIAPAPPTAIEAFALDLADPTLIKDAAYTAWRTRFPTVVGLRVRWAWPETHLLQAPRTREFRIYYQPGHLNALPGNTRAVVAAGATESTVTTDIPNAELPGSYVGAALHAGEDAFVIVGSEGSPLRVRVRNVGPNHDIAPRINVPCTIAIPSVYSAGAATVWNGSTIVTGIDTDWTTTLAGMLVQIATDEREYRIALVDSPTQLTLEEPYAGLSKSERVYSIRHPRFIDYSLPVNWQRRYHVVNFDQNWTSGTDAEGRPVRRYEVFLPAEAAPGELPLTASRSDPIVYANIGVSAADDRSHTADDPKWTGPWAGRPGNEGRIGPPAKIFRVHREPPPAPVLPRMPEQMFATRADQTGASFFTFRWQPLEKTKTHVFRAFDDALFNLDWSQRPRPALDPTQVGFFPLESIDPRWTAAKRQQVATELNHLNSFGHDAAGTAQAFTYYRGLSADALRVLAGLLGNEGAFTQITTAPLDPSDPLNANRRGPDDPDNFQIGDPNNPLSSPALRIFIDKLDGRTTNRHLYRAANIDDAQNRSPLSVASPPGQAPSVVPPRAPVVTKAIAGDQEITIHWASSRERDLARYQIYRTDDPERTGSVGLMTLVQTVPVSGSAPAEFVWTDLAVPAGKDLFYRLVAEDRHHNFSDPSPPVVARAFDNLRPQPPIWGAAVTTPTGLLLNFTPSHPSHRAVIQRRDVELLTEEWSNLSPWLAPGTQQWTDSTREPGHRYVYRIRVFDKDGKTNKNFNELTI